MAEHYECKTQILGPDPNDQKEARVLNRIVTLQTNQSGEMVTYEADPRDAKFFMQEAELTQCKPVASPSVKMEVEEEAEYLSDGQSTRYRSLVARANCLALGRPDLQYACKEFSASMCKPSVSDWEALKKLVKYLRGKPRFVHRCWSMGRNTSFNMCTDASWANNRRIRKSTSGGCVMIGAHWIKSWSKTHSLIAASSAESELYASVKATAESSGIQSMARDMNMELRVRILADASVALGIVSRRGVGKIRHLDINCLWIQKVSARKRATFEKVKGSENPADLVIKDLPRAEVDKYVESIGAAYPLGRAEVALHVADDEGEVNELLVTISPSTARRRH